MKSKFNKIPNRRLEKELNRQFPKRGKIRRKVLALLGVAQIEIDLAEIKAIREFKEETASMFEQELKLKLKKKLKESKDDWITTLRRELKEEMIDNL